MEDAHGIVGAEDGDGAAEPELSGARRRGGEDHRRGRGDEVGPVMLAQGKDVETDLLGQLDGLEQILQALGRRDQLPGVGIGGQLGEGIEANFECVVCDNGKLRVELFG